MTYNVYLKKLNGWFWKKYVVKGHMFTNVLGAPEGGAAYHCNQTRLELYFTNESVLIFPADQFCVKLDETWFRLHANKIKEESNGQVKL